MALMRHGLALCTMTALALLLVACSAFDLPDNAPHSPPAPRNDAERLSERLSMATAYENHGLLDKAAVEYKAALALATEDPEILKKLARISIILGRHDESESYSSRLAGITPDDPEVYQYLAWSYAKGKKDYAAAMEAMDRALAYKSDKTPDFLETKGLILMEQERYEDAISTFDESLKELGQSAHPANAKARRSIELHKNKARSFRKLGREQEARQSLEKAMELGRALGIRLKDN